MHHDIHPAQVLITSDGRPRISDLGQCSVLSNAFSKELLPALGRRDFCRPAKLSRLQGPELDGYGCGATLWVTWKVRLERFTPAPSPWLGRLRLSKSVWLIDSVGHRGRSISRRRSSAIGIGTTSGINSRSPAPLDPIARFLCRSRTSISHIYALILPCHCTRNT